MKVSSSVHKGLDAEMRAFLRTLSHWPEESQRRTFIRKLTPRQLADARKRVAAGESTRAVARDLHVTEGALRRRWRESEHPRPEMRVGLELASVARALAQLSPEQQRAAQRLAAQRLHPKDSR